MAWNLRKVFEETHLNREDPKLGISIPNDKRLIHQLSARKYDYRSDGRIKIEAKSDMRKRGEKSPDRADALAMAWWIRKKGNIDPHVVEANREAVKAGYGASVYVMDF